MAPKAEWVVGNSNLRRSETREHALVDFTMYKEGLPRLLYKTRIAISISALPVKYFLRLTLIA